MNTSTFNTCTSSKRIDFPQKIQKNIKEEKLYIHNCRLGEKLVELMDKTGRISLLTLASICADPIEFSAVFFHVNVQILPFIEHVNGIPDRFAKLKHALTNALGCIDILQIFTDIEYFLKKALKDTKIEIAAMAASFIADIRLTILWLEHLNFIKINELPSVLKNGMFAKFLNLISARAFFISYTLYSISTFLKYRASEEPQMALECIKNMMEALFELTMALGFLNIWGIGILSLLCVAARLGCIVHRIMSTQKI